MASLFISHDLLSVRRYTTASRSCNRAESSNAGHRGQTLREPRTEDTRALLQAVLRNSVAASD
jgi:ABC-type glutathione transport system ATPase component